MGEGALDVSQRVGRTIHMLDHTVLWLNVPSFGVTHRVFGAR